MFRRMFMIGLSVILFAIFSGCAAYAVSPVTGFLYTDVRGPAMATGADGYSKVGMAVSKSYLGFIAEGDASIEAAMKNGGITKIHHVDFESKNILGLYATFTVYVYGD
ncbi:MAG: TRL-like family protein [Calditrichia bacterium]